MRSQPPKRWLHIGLIFLLVLCLVLVRAFEDTLFYDPFLLYFKGEYSNKPLPAFEDHKLFFGLLFRYVMNSTLSLGIIYFAFLDGKAVRFISMIYVLLFVLLISSLWITLYYCADCKLAIFYERRFLIQPLFLLLFLPGIYYQRQLVKK